MEHIHGSHDLLMVFVSYAVAVAASYTVLDLAGNVATSAGRIRVALAFIRRICDGHGHLVDAFCRHAGLQFAGASSL